MGQANMQAALLRSSRFTRPAMQSVARRQMSILPGEAATTEHAIEATADWKKYSMYGAGFVGAVAVLQFFVHMSHGGHHEEQVVYGFRKIRDKPFPWGDGQHSLFGCTVDEAE